MQYDDYDDDVPTTTSKKRCRVMSHVTVRAQSSRDCFEQVLRQAKDSDQVVRSSWLCHVEWIDDKNDSFREEEDEDHLQSQLESLAKQLLQVKRRLGPAAEKCAQESCGSTTASEQFVQARRACNPMESLGEGQGGGLNNMFMNRSAIKLANMDAMLDFCISHLLPEEKVFQFVDLCGAPGGFSEYLLRRCMASGVSCRGYGLSLVGSNEHGRATEWKLDNNIDYQESDGVRIQYRVCLGADGTGDIFHWGNIESVKSTIQRDDNSSTTKCEGGGVHLVVADGGFDAQRDAEDQEGIAQKLVVCEVAAALELLQPGGTLVLKCFGFQASVTRSVMHDLFAQFDRMIVVKPISSRPASAERYVVCRGFRGRGVEWSGPRWRDQMFLGRPSIDPGHKIMARYLNVLDRDFLTLNLKACYAVLNHLEAKCAGLAWGEQEGRLYLDIEAYKYAWNLI